MTPAATTNKDKPKTGITLGDLSEADRRELLAEAKEAAKRNPVEVDGYEALSDREKAIRALMDARDHSRGCPVGEGLELGRIEGHDGRVPPNPAIGQAAYHVAVIRCMECGGETILNGKGSRPLLELEPAIKLALDKDLADGHTSVESLVNDD